MRSLEVVALPSFKRHDREWLARLRAARDPDKSAPHITLVFPGSDLPWQEFAAEIKERVRGVRRIRFQLCTAVVVADPQVQAFHVFLVPDEGYGALTRLYGRLHSGPLAEIMRKDITYLPHVTVASADDWATAHRLATQLNAQDFSIAGTITELEVQMRTGGDAARKVASIPLKRGGIWG